jgi:hypothetical protein
MGLWQRAMIALARSESLTTFMQRRFTLSAQRPVSAVPVTRDKPATRR